MAQKRSTTRRKSTKRRKSGTRSKTTRGGTRGSGSSRKQTSSRSRKRTRKRTKRELRLDVAQKALLVGILIIFITGIFVLSLLSPEQGELTRGLRNLMLKGFGWGGWLVPLITFAIGGYLVLWGMDQPLRLSNYRLSGAGLLYFAFEGAASLILLQMDNSYIDVKSIADAGTGGGWFGGLIAGALVGGVGELGAAFTLTVIAVAGTILVSGVTREEMGLFLKKLFEKRPSRQPRSAGERQITINTPRTRRASQDEEPVQPPLIPEPAETAPQPKPKPRQQASQRRKPAPKKDETPTVVTPVFLGNSGRSGSHNWQLPVLANMLEPGTDQDPSGVVIREQVEIIEHTLDSFGAPAKVVEINQGPTITQFGVEPKFIEMRSGKRTKVKVGKIASLADDLALALAAASIRIQAPVPGKAYVGIEVPNPAKALVSLRDVMETPEFQKIKSPLRICLGQDVGGQPIVADLSAMPHLLIAGTTGSGKSVCVNSIITCLLLLNTPDQLKLVMVDPKRVELTGYNGIPHLAAPVVVEIERVIGVLQWAMREMDSRYKMLADVGARNILDYNKKTRRNKNIDPLPNIVIIVDELADLMMLSPEETERGITRLAQLARATGIHMVIATQRPSVDVVTGLIKANFPARVAFAVASSTDSRVILDTTGAERLLGQGDMLYQSPDAAAPIRSQGCFVSPAELDKLIDYWKSARRFNLIPATESITRRPEATPPPPPSSKNETPKSIDAPVINMDAPAAVSDDAPTVASKTTKTAAASRQETKSEPTPQQPLWEALQEEAQKPEHEDELMPEVIELVRKLNKASTSLLQRRFRIGYTRAARMIDALEEMGVIGPPTGTSKAREVLPWGDEQDGSAENNKREGEAEA